VTNGKMVGLWVTAASKSGVFLMAHGAYLNTAKYCDNVYSVSMEHEN